MVDRMLHMLLVVLNLFLAITTLVGGVWVIPALPQEWFRLLPSYANGSSQSGRNDAAGPRRNARSVAPAGG